MGERNPLYPFGSNSLKPRVRAAFPKNQKQRKARLPVNAMRNGGRTHLCEVVKSCGQAWKRLNTYGGDRPIHITIQYTLHNHPPGESAPSDADIRLTRRLAEGARILQINVLDHVIVGQSFENRPGYFSFKEAGLI